jgi:hypothetical protein
MKNQSPGGDCRRRRRLHDLLSVIAYILYISLLREVDASPAISLSAIKLARQRRNSHRSVNGLNYRKKESAALAKIICLASVVPNSLTFKMSLALNKITLIDCMTM